MKHIIIFTQFNYMYVKSIINSFFIKFFFQIILFLVIG
ncbi:unnamed protein product [Musa acuminata subsp. malaccensis]|uniref:(wild Malaysian banana) hypothetical protein n=1 Tax=Musa acuminata subsp. malaccensis TaxID=214687 RepID=A0A8D6ZM66_MUSAM|nr:unnamed protein product [Musa acuminata subsp. malaccensis]